MSYTAGLYMGITMGALASIVSGAAPLGLLIFFAVLAVAFHAMLICDFAQEDR